MAIRISHARADTAGQLGLEAGKGEQKVRQQAQQFEADLQSQADSSRIQAAKINADTAIQKSVMDDTNNREMQEFESFMRAESDRRQIAWRTEQVEMTQRHDFEINMQRKDLENQMIMEKEARKTAEVDQKKDALKKELDNHGISPDKYQELLLGLELGADMGRMLAGPSGEAGFMKSQREREKVMKIRATAERTKPENVAMRTADIITQIADELEGLDPETKAEADALIKTPNLSEAAALGILDTLRAKKEVLAKEKRLGVMGGFAFGP